MAAHKTDEPGVLGNLPRSRPGHRSDKRGAGAAAAGVDASASSTSGGEASRATPSTRAKAARGKPSARAKTAARGSKAAAGSAGTATREPRPQVESPEAASHGPGDPLTGAVRLAGKVAEAGLKRAGSLLRRLPGR
jgi:hypothetical protein